jgi:hypothetical protein
VHAIPLRVVASSMGGQWLKVEAFQESVDPVSGQPTVLCKPGGSVSSTDTTTQANWERIEEKRAMARGQHTTYCYDLPALMEQQLVREACNGGGGFKVSAPHTRLRKLPSCVSVHRAGGTWALKRESLHRSISSAVSQHVLLAPYLTLTPDPRCGKSTCSWRTSSY